MVFGGWFASCLWFSVVFGGCLDLEVFLGISDGEYGLVGYGKSMVLYLPVISLKLDY